MAKKNSMIKVYLNIKEGEISPLLYGGGFEDLGGAIHLGLDAQMLDGMSFEEEDVNQDGISDKWLPAGHGDHLVRYSRDGGQVSNGSYSQKIEMVDYRNGERGIKQGSLFITRRKNYFTSLHLLQNGMGSGSSVAVSLRKGKKIYAHQTVRDISSEWKKHVLPLRPNESSLDAEFWITLKGGGTLWVDQVSLCPEDTFKGHGTRKDIMESILSLGPTFIRWPGGWFSENYHWKDGIGLADRRPVRKKYYSSIKAKSDPSWESNRFGTNEFIQFCRDIGAAPILTINIGYGEEEPLDELIEEASAWVEYCNGNSMTPYGNLRQANGFSEPFGVKYWGIGNEPWEMDPVDYANRFIKFAQALKMKDPAIKLIAAGGYGYQSQWNEKVLQVAGAYIDYLDLHYYFRGQYLDAMAEPLKYEEFLKTLGGKISGLTSNRDIRLAVLEWNSYTHLKDGNRLKEGLFAAGFLNMMERQSDLIALSSLWPLLRKVQPSWNYLSDLGLIQYDHHRSYLSPSALAFKLYRHHFAPDRVRCEVCCPVLTLTKGKGYEVPCLDVVSTRDRKRRALVLKVINRDPRKNIPSDIIIEDVARPLLSATVSTLNALDINAKNSLDYPDDVKITSKEMDCKSGRFEYLFPAHSVTVIRLEIPVLKSIDN